MTAAVLHFPALQQLCRPNGPAPRPSTVRRWADRIGVVYRPDASGGIWTTQAALDAALGITPQTEATMPVEDLA